MCNTERGYVNKRGDFVFICIICVQEFGHEFVVFVQAYGAVIVAAFELTASEFEYGKAYQFAFSPVCNVVPVFAVEYFNNVLILHDGERFQSVSKACCFFKVEAFRGAFHFCG